MPPRNRMFNKSILLYVIILIAIILIITEAAVLNFQAVALSDKNNYESTFINITGFRSFNSTVTNIEHNSMLSRINVTAIIHPKFVKHELGENEQNSLVDISPRNESIHKDNRPLNLMLSPPNTRVQLYSLNMSTKNSLLSISPRGIKGIDFNVNPGGFIPPDVSMTVGTNHILETVRIR